MVPAMFLWKIKHHMWRCFCHEFECVSVVMLWVFFFFLVLVCGTKWNMTKIKQFILSQKKKKKEHLCNGVFCIKQCKVTEFNKKLKVYKFHFYWCKYDLINDVMCKVNILLVIWFLFIISYPDYPCLLPGGLWLNVARNHISIQHFQQCLTKQQWSVIECWEK